MESLANEEYDVDIMDWNFDSFAVDKAKPKGALIYVIHGIIHYNRSQIPLKMQEHMVSLFEIVAPRYNVSWTRPVYFHTSIHAADVCQAMHWLLQGPPQLMTKLVSVIPSFPLVFSACIIAAVLHDYDHPGLNANFLIQTHNALALTYNNDPSLLEMHHVAKSFQLLESSGLLLDLFSPDEERLFRKILVELIMSTSMVKHEERLLKPLQPETDYLHCLQVALHCADISNAGRPKLICRKWLHCLMEELWAQGDTEKELGISTGPLLERSNPHLSSLQLSFSRNICRPLFLYMHTLCPQISAWVECLDENETQYVSLTD